MSASIAELGARLQQQLKLSNPPFAIRFSAEAPRGIERIQADMPPPTADGRTGAVPASCVFWIKAQEASFTTTAEDHGNCSVGSLTHGFKTLDEVAGNADVGALVDSGWVSPEIFPQIPVVTETPAYITYSPLSETSDTPDVVFMRLNAKQAMVLSDALPDLRFEGKPQCHIIAIAKQQNLPAVSVGCMLSRVRTGLPNTEMTCALPGAQLESIVEKLETTCGIDGSVAAYAAEDSGRFNADQRGLQD